MQSAEEMVGGSPWVNLTNTVCYTNGVLTDRLDDGQYLLHFLHANELCREEQLAELCDAPQQESLMRKIKQMRKIFWLIIDRIDAGKHMLESQAQALTEFVQQEIQVEYAYSMRGADQSPLFAWRGKTLLDDLLLKLVNSFTVTMETVALDRIRKCEHDQCILHFVDTSKAGKRRWCSMTTCGNRFKAATYYSKHKKKIGETAEQG